MSASDVLNVLVLAAVVAYLIAEVRHRRKRARMFAACGEKLGLQDASYAGGDISGTVRGLHLEVHFVAGTKQTPSYTTVDVVFSPCPLLLHLRPQDEEETRSVERGEAIDLLVDDPAFDAAWIVEGAPAERVARVLADPGLRARLLAFRGIDRASVKIEDGKVSLHRGGTEVGADEIATERITLALALAEAVITEAATPLASSETDPAAGDYRSAPRADGDASGAAKIAALKELRATRAIAQLRVATIAATSLLSVVLLCFQLVSDLPPIIPTLPVLLMVILVTVAIGSAYRNERRSAPGLPHDKVLVGWMVGTWALDLALALRAALTR